MKYKILITLRCLTAKAVKQWFDNYIPQGTDKINTIINNIKSLDDFSPGDYFSTEKDKETFGLIKEAVISIFGRHTYTQMCSGTLFMKDGRLDYISHPWMQFTYSLRANGFTLPHNIITLRLKHKMTDFSKIQYALLDIMTLGLEEILETGTKPTSNMVSVCGTIIPTELWMPMYKELHEINSENHESFFNLLSYQAASALFDVTSREVKTLTPRASGNMKLYNILAGLYKDQVDLDDSLTSTEKTIYKTALSEALNFLIFASAKTTDIEQRVRIREYLEGEGIWNGDPLIARTNKIKNQHAYLKSLDLDQSQFNEFFINDYVEIIESLYPASLKPTRTTSLGVFDYYSENILRTQRDGIIKFGNFIRELTNSYNDIELIPLSLYSGGYAISTRTPSTFVPTQKSTISSIFGTETYDVYRFSKNHLDDGTLNENFAKVLGGLLVEHQTFVVKVKDGDYLCAINLLDGAISLNNYIIQPKTQHYQIAPYIASFSGDLYTTDDNELNINTIMNHFSEHLINYQRIQDKEEELATWLELCNNLHFISSAFEK